MTPIPAFGSYGVAFGTTILQCTTPHLTSFLRHRCGGFKSPPSGRRRRAGNRELPCGRHVTVDAQWHRTGFGRRVLRIDCDRRSRLRSSGHPPLDDGGLVVVGDEFRRPVERGQEPPVDSSGVGDSDRRFERFALLGRTGVSARPLCGTMLAHIVRCCSSSSRIRRSSETTSSVLVVVPTIAGSSSLSVAFAGRSRTRSRICSLIAS